MIWKTIEKNTGYIVFSYGLVGTYRLPDGKLVLIDSGTEEAPELLDDLKCKGISVRAVINTHLHVDHVANNRALQKYCGAEIYASALEIASAKEDYIRDCVIQAIPENMPDLMIGGASFRIIPLPGHSPGHAAVVTPDGVCFLGDALMIGNYLRMSKLPYMEDVNRSLVSMEKIRETQFTYYVFAHKGICTRDTLDRVIDKNVEKEIELYNQLKEQVRGEMTVEMLRETLKDILEISESARDKAWLNETIESRIRELVYAGEIRQKNGLLYPKQ